MAFLIVTKYLGPTNTRGARVKATWLQSGKPRSVTVPYDYELDSGMAHSVAATTAMLESGRSFADYRELGRAETHDGKGYAFILEAK